MGDAVIAEALGGRSPLDQQSEFLTHVIAAVRRRTIEADLDSLAPSESTALDLFLETERLDNHLIRQGSAGGKYGVELLTSDKTIRAVILI
jgi:hypothetical protein